MIGLVASVRRGEAEERMLYVVGVGRLVLDDLQVQRGWTWTATTDRSGSARVRSSHLIVLLEFTSRSGF